MVVVVAVVAFGVVDIFVVVVVVAVFGVNDVVVGVVVGTADVVVAVVGDF